MRADPGPAAALDEIPADTTPGRSLLAKLDAFRRPFLRIVIALLLGFLLAFAFATRIRDVIMKPLARVLPDGSRLIYTQTAEGFMLNLKIAALVGLILASPYLLWQVWRLLVPVLSRRARRRALAFVFFATLLFLAGASFAHFVVFPWVWTFLASFATSYMQFMPAIAPTFSLYVKIVLALGLTFQMPVVVFFLARLGVVTHRTLIHYGRYAVLVAFIVGAVVTPPDIVSQVLLAAPLVGLYGLAIGIAWLCAPSKRDA